jgi:hypothetical protein
MLLILLGNVDVNGVRGLHGAPMNIDKHRFWVPLAGLVLPDRIRGCSGQGDGKMEIEIGPRGRPTEYATPKTSTRPAWRQAQLVKPPVQMGISRVPELLQREDSPRY